MKQTVVPLLYGRASAAQTEHSVIKEVIVNILFDLDGTLTDPRPGIVSCIRHALSILKERVPPESDLERFIGPPLREIFCELLATTADDERIPRGVTAYRDRFATIGIFENRVYEGIPRVLLELRSRKAQLFVVTSKPHVYARRILEHFGLAQHFCGVYGSELDGTRSNKGELIAYTLADAELRAEDTVMVGDRSHDVVGAVENGLLPVGVLWGYGSREELTAASAQELYSQPDDLVQLVV